MKFFFHSPLLPEIMCAYFYMQVCVPVSSIVCVCMCAHTHIPVPFICVWRAKDN